MQPKLRRSLACLPIRVSKMESCRKYRKWLFDLFLYSCVLTFLLISYFGAFILGYTYINCGDTSSIGHKLLDDTISIPLLLCICILVPFIKMTLVEWFSTPLGYDSRFQKGVQRSLDYMSTIMVGGLFAFFVVEILKTTVGEARPHFMSSCKPNLTENCSCTWVHVTVKNCINPLNLTERKLADSMKSFPSGHACVGIFTTVFMSVYTHIRLQVVWSRLFPWVLQLAWWIWGLLCCITRIWDYKHFWWDVAVGAAIGAVVAYAAVSHLCNWFEEEKGEKSNSGPLLQSSSTDSAIPTGPSQNIVVE